MVVGEPSLMGGEFGDEDERLITRLENTQYEGEAVDWHPPHHAGLAPHSAHGTHAAHGTHCTHGTHAPASPSKTPPGTH